MEKNLSYEFDSFRLIPAERQLLRDGEAVPLPPKAFDTLLILIQNSGHALKKDDLIKHVWPDSFVEESNLNHNISVLRKALGDSNGDGYVETVRGYGFRFKANVRSTPESLGVLVHKHTRTHVVYREAVTGSEKTTTVIERSGISGRTVSVMVIVILGLGTSATYFGLVRPARSRNLAASSTAPPAVRTKAYENPGARAAYLKGRYFWNQRNPDAIRKAQRSFQDALEIDSNFAPAYVGLADCLLMGGSVPGLQETSKSLALKAIAIDNSLGEAHASLAYYMSAVEWDWAGAEVEFERAVALDPDYATAHHWHAYNLASLGRLEEALAEMKRAEALDPVSVIIKTDIGQMLYFARRYNEAISQYLKALQLNPEFRIAHLRLTEGYIQTRKYDEAASHLQRALTLQAEKPPGLEAWVAYAKAVTNSRAEAFKILNRMKSEAEIRRWCYYIAFVYAGLGDKDSAFVWLDKSLGYREGQLALIKVDPMFDNLRDDPRFAELLRQMNLPTS